MARAILILNGPSLDRLGERPSYSEDTLEMIRVRINYVAELSEVKLRFVQSTHEGDLVGAVWAAKDDGLEGAVVNAGAYSVSSYALLDALEGARLPFVEVHTTNVYAREPWRSRSVLAPLAVGVVAGFGWRSYLMALEALLEWKQDRFAAPQGPV